MNEKIKIGCFFFALAAFLYATKHLTAAVMTTHMNNPQANYYEGGLSAVGWGMTVWITLSFLTGLTFFLWGVWPTIRQQVEQQKND